KTDDARRVLDAALFYHWKATSLWDLKVKTAATYAEEESIYRTLTKLFPVEDRYRVALGTVLVKRHNHAGAVAVLEPLTNKAAAVVRAKAHYQLAHSHYHEKDYAASLKHLELARTADRSFLEPVDALHFLARVQEKVGKTGEAIRTYEQALKAEP